MSLQGFLRRTHAGAPRGSSIPAHFIDDGSSVMRVLRRFNEFLMTAGNWGTILFMTVIAVVIPYEVTGRYVFQKMTIWSGEVSTYSLVWASMLGGAVGLKKGYMISMTTVLESVPPGVVKFLKFLSYLCALFFFGAMFGYGLFQTIYNAQQTSPAIGLVMSIPYAALPTGFFIMFFLTMEEFLLFLGLSPQGGGQ
jgi:TRAP-type C4-dicarboxylate transport system permease small subunit